MLKPNFLFYKFHLSNNISTNCFKAYTFKHLANNCYIFSDKSNLNSKTGFSLTQLPFTNQVFTIPNIKHRALQISHVSQQMVSISGYVHLTPNILYNPQSYAKTVVFPFMTLLTKFLKMHKYYKIKILLFALQLWGKEWKYRIHHYKLSQNKIYIGPVIIHYNSGFQI